MTDDPPRLFLFFANMALGGIETLILKVANQMADEGRTVVLAGEEAELSKNLSPQITRIFTLQPRLLARRLSQLSGSQTSRPHVTIVSVHPWELLRAAILNWHLSTQGYRVASFHLVPFSRAYFIETRFPQLRRLLRTTFFRAPTPSTYFMNEAARESHHTYWNVDLSKYPILRLPIAEPTVSWEPHAAEVYRVVSVGRLVPFKGYNLAAPHVTRVLREASIPLTWDIWGYGPDEAKVAQAIEQTGTHNSVHLRGILPYEKYNDTVVQYDLFVGMGTALLEAARLGMPAVTSVEGTEHETYGFLHETPLDSVGDVVAGVATRSLETVVRDAATLSTRDAVAIGRRCRESALERSSRVQEVVDAIDMARDWPLNRSDWRWLAMGSLLLRLRDIRLAMPPRS